MVYEVGKMNTAKYKDEIFRMLAQNYTTQEIMDAVGCSKSTVGFNAKKFREERTVRRGYDPMGRLGMDYVAYKLKDIDG